MSENASLPLANRVALVVGASRGIGREAALALAKAGAHVIAAARTQGALEELDDEIFAATGQHASLVPFDLVDGGAIDRLGGGPFGGVGKGGNLGLGAGWAAPCSSDSASWTSGFRPPPQWARRA